MYVQLSVAKGWFYVQLSVSTASRLSLPRRA